MLVVVVVFFFFHLGSFIITNYFYCFQSISSECGKTKTKVISGRSKQYKITQAAIENSPNDRVVLVLPLVVRNGDASFKTKPW